MNNQFSENLKKIRKDHNLSQEQLADELGVSRQAISKWESATAHPEMDKIIALCSKFDLNIDDLLHKDITEIKSEEESKKKINKTIDDFLNFITDTINLFSNMDFKSKIKCLIEQIIIISIFLIISATITLVSDQVFYNLLSILPLKIHYFMTNCLSFIVGLFCAITSVIIITHVFKTRYLDYFNKLKKEINTEKEDKNIEIKEQDNEENINHKNKILFKKNEDKIIIRDPKHSEYKFINSLFKFVIGIIKFFALCFALTACLVLITLFICLVLSFLVYKTKFFFLGLIFTILSSIVITVIALLVLLNFIFNRKNEKKKMIWSFIISVAFFGIGIGLLFIGTLDFEVVNNDSSLLKTEIREYDMKDDRIFKFYNVDKKYVESDINNIKVEYKINKFYKIVDSEYEEDIIPVWVNCSDPIKLTKEFINNLNNKKIILMTDEINSVTIYASKENIKKLKENEKDYYTKQEMYDNMSNYYQEKINDLEEKVDNYELKIFDYENQINELNSMLNNCQTNVDLCENN